MENHGASLSDQIITILAEIYLEKHFNSNSHLSKILELVTGRIYFAYTLIMSTSRKTVIIRSKFDYIKG